MVQMGVTLVSEERILTGLALGVAVAGIPFVACGIYALRRFGRGVLWAGAIGWAAVVAVLSVVVLFLAGAAGPSTSWLPTGLFILWCAGIPALIATLALTKARENWGSRTTAVAASVGYAVGVPLGFVSAFLLP